MHEIDFLPVGNGSDSGDAITLRFTRPDTRELAHVVIDAGFQSSGLEVVKHVKEVYGTSSIDLAILTHPDRDHIGGMGHVVRDLDVKTLWLHDLASHGGQSLRAAPAVKDLISVAREQGTGVYEAWAGATEFGGALRILGPDRDWYEELVAEQVARESREAAEKSSEPGSSVIEAAATALQRFLEGHGVGLEVPFTDRGGPGPRNNTSIVTSFRFDGYHAVLTADAGCDALERAWDELGRAEGITTPPAFIQMPHHGSRVNGSSSTLDRLLGSTGQPEARTAVISVVPESPDHPSGRIVNAYKRRGYRVYRTAEKKLCESSPDAPVRFGWGPAVPLETMVEDDDDI